MTLLTCPRCRNQTSSRIKKCSECWGRWIAATITLLVSLLLVAGLVDFKSPLPVFANATAVDVPPTDATLVRNAERQCKSYVQRFANDPDSISLEAISMPELNDLGEYIMAARVRGNNLFGAKAMKVYFFVLDKSGLDDWTVVEGEEGEKFLMARLQRIRAENKETLNR